MKRVLSYLVLSFISALSLYFCLLSINFININLIKNHKSLISILLLTTFLFLLLIFIFSNVKKYALPGTRVYVDVYKEENFGVFSNV